MENKLKFASKLAYGAGDFGANFCWTTFMSAFALIYFTDTAGLSAASVGTLILVSRFLDGFSDILIGGFIDRTKSKMGKARPWLLCSSFPLMIALILLFNVPSSFSDSGKYAYLFIVYTILGSLFYTASNISYNSLVSLAARDPQDRVSMGSIRFIFGLIGALIVTSVTMVFVNHLGGGQRAWTIVTFLYAMIFIAFTMITVAGVKELKIQGAGEKGGTEKAGTIGIGKSLRYLLKNKFFFINLGLFINFHVSIGISNTTGIYYVSYILGDPALMGLISLAGFVPLIVALPLAPKLTGRFGMQRTCLIGGVFSTVGTVVILFCGNNLPVLMAGFVIRALGTVPFTGSMFALTAEIAEYATLKFKVHTEGIIYTCSSVGMKFGTGMGVAITGWLLTRGGYAGGIEVQSESALKTIQNIYLITPIVSSIVMVLLLSVLSVEKENKELRAAIQAQANPQA